MALVAFICRGHLETELFILTGVFGGNTLLCHVDEVDWKFTKYPTLIKNFAIDHGDLLYKNAGSDINLLLCSEEGRREGQVEDTFLIIYISTMLQLKHWANAIAWWDVLQVFYEWQMGYCPAMKPPSGKVLWLQRGWAHPSFERWIYSLSVPGRNVCFRDERYMMDSTAMKSQSEPRGCSVITFSVQKEKHNLIDSNQSLLVRHSYKNTFLNKI